jgi:cobalamin biosynthesis protein CbiD
MRHFSTERITMTEEQLKKLEEWLDSCIEKQKEAWTAAHDNNDLQAYKFFLGKKQQSVQTINFIKNLLKEE